MSINRGLFTSATEHWETPAETYAALDTEFHFTDDPCPRHPVTDGLSREWGTVTFCNPPYGKKICDWLLKGYIESLKGKTVVFLIPSRTDTRWWHDFVMKAHEVRFIKGRLKFDDHKNSAPFPSAIVIFDENNYGT